MIAFAYVLPYHVLRAATAAGHQVHVLGTGASRGLKWSRYCASYNETRCDWHGLDSDLLLDDIGRAVRNLAVDIVLPSDDVSTRLVSALRHRLPIPTSPVPDVATFDLLNNKWNFTRFCLAHGVRVPQVWLYRDVEELRTALDSGTLQLPITAKPLSRSGGIGVIHMCAPPDLALVDAIDYRPVLVQRYIRGETIGISIVARNGELLSHATQRRDERRFELFANPDLLENVRRLAAAVSLTGPANFDAVLEDETGASYIVECNPRFWYTIYMPMLLGLNFVDLAIRDRIAPPLLDGELRLSFRDILRQPRRMDRFDRMMLRYHLADPLPYLFQRRNWFDDKHISVPSEKISDCGDPSPSAAVQTAHGSALVAETGRR